MVAEKTEKKAIISDSEVDKIALSTGEKLKRQEKKKVKLYLDPQVRQQLQSAMENGKKVEWPFEIVSINGYTFQIQKGIEVEVPLSVAKVLENAGLI
jgi:hypothetical protein